MSMLILANMKYCQLLHNQFFNSGNKALQKSIFLSPLVKVKTAKCLSGMPSRHPAPNYQ